MNTTQPVPSYSPSRRFVCHFVLIASLTGAMANQAHAQRDAVGIGAMIGFPSGFSVKKWTSNTIAVDGGAAWALGRDPGLQVHSDILFHRSDLEGLKENRSYAYYGLGGRLKWEDNDTRLGIRVPLGVTYLFPDAPLDSFIEILPVFDIFPETRILLNMSIGMRFYFSPL